jgi:hypothetical protein
VSFPSGQALLSRRPVLTLRQKGFVVLRAVQNVNDQVVTKHAAADATLLVAGKERVGEGIVCKLHCALSKLANEVSGAQGVVLRDVVTDPPKIAKSFVRKADLHNCPRSRAMPV